MQIGGGHLQSLAVTTHHSPLTLTTDHSPLTTHVVYIWAGLMDGQRLPLLSGWPCPSLLSLPSLPCPAALLPCRHYERELARTVPRAR